MEGCIITINNQDYYYPCDYKDNLKVIDNRLINIGSNTITLYRNFPSYGDNSSGYPRIYLPSNTKAYYRNSYNSTYSELVVNSLEFKSSFYGFDIYLFIVLICVLVLNLFRR